MSASEITEPQRFSVRLDPSLVIERLILRRLSGLKRGRGQDWLRSLLVQGFLVEGQWIRSERERDCGHQSVQEDTIPKSPFAHWLEHASAPARRAFEPTAPTPAPESLVTNVAADTKPFAHLRTVIG